MSVGIFNSAIFNNAVFNTGTVTPPPTPERNSGGWPTHARRYPTPDEIKRQRIALGILPKEETAAAIIEPIAERLANEQITRKQAVAEVSEAVALNALNIEMKRGTEILIALRDALLDEEEMLVISLLM